MAAIDVGFVTTDIYGGAGNSTFILADNPANLSGKLTSIDFQVHDAVTNLVVAIFEKVNGNNFTARDRQVLGDYGVAEHLGVAVDLDIVAGDYIGFFTSSGMLSGDAGGEGSVGYWLKGGDHTECIDTTFTWQASFGLYLWGDGEELPAGWTGKISGVTNPAKIMGVDVANIAKVKGVT